MTTSANKTANTNHDTGTKPKVMNYRTAMKLLRQVVKGREDHKAPCAYFKNKGTYSNKTIVPVCIVGEAIALYDPEILNKIKNDVRKSPYGVVHEETFNYFGVTLSTNATNVLGAAQEWQDAKASWKKALEEAEEKFNQIKAKREQP